MKTFAVFTPFIEGVAEKRLPYREAHLAHVRAMAESGLLILGGALVDPMDQGLLIMRAESKDDIQKELEKDSYWNNDIWRKNDVVIREWNVVVGTIDPAGMFRS